MSNKIKLFAWMLLIVFVGGCSTGSKISNPEKLAEQAIANNDYAAALKAYEEIITGYRQESRTQECPVYGKAGQAAFETGDYNKAADYFEMDTYTSFVNEKTYWGLVESFKKVDNLSKEIMALKNYMDLYPNGFYVEQARQRLFETSVESENWDSAVQLWPTLPATTKSKIHFLNLWFVVNQKTGNEEECETLANTILEADSTNIAALQWKAEKAYSSAEDHYNVEMEAYDKNKTNKQYKKLLAELDEVTAEFQVALKYFETLYQLDPNPEYAMYMSNIYVRFNDKKKADYYRQKAGQ